ncbi:uncharacterized protein LOC126738276 [Anthonomus grandis grandis]|uniref:uncharacterized protein LOC126738276 n=1 Tax=Anthonomus grandis grandis TaxID=2921223 RepID=UPI0021654EE5|nr:uncharacterized protein LOC126738276 [Anthonomus grandis grandis]
MPEKTSDEETDTEFNIESHQQVIPDILSSTSYHNEKDTDTKLNVEPWEITPETLCSHNETNTNTKLNVEESGETLTETSSSTLYDENKTDTDLNIESREVTPETVPTSHAEKETVLQHQSSEELIQESLLEINQSHNQNQGSFLRHLMYPEPVTYKKKVSSKEKLPSAISSVA